MSAGSAASNLGYAKIIPNSNINGNFVNKDNSHYPGGFGSNQIPGLPGLAGAKYNVDAAAARVPGICMSGGGKKLKRKIKNITKIYKMPKKSMKRKVSGMKRKIKAILSRAMTRSRTMSRSRGRGVAISGGEQKLQIKNITKRYKMSNKGKKRKVKASLSRAMSRSRTMSRTLARGLAVAGGKRSRRTKRQRGGYSQYQNNLPMTNSYSTGGVLSAANLGLANPVPYQALSNCTNCVDNYNHFTNSGFPSRGH